VGSHASLHDRSAKSPASPANGGGPVITVTDFSSSKNLTHNSSYASNKSEEFRFETEPLMLNQTETSFISNMPSSGVSSMPAHQPSRVRFHVGETILEESPNASQVKMESPTVAAAAAHNE